MTRKYSGLLPIFTLYALMAFMVRADEVDTVFCPEEYPLKPYLCPTTDDVCVSDYNHCNFLSNSCNDSVLPFRCPAATQTSDEIVCVADPSTECCTYTDAPILCPHSGECVASEDSCCSLNADTPFYCTSTDSCVAHQYDCCDELEAFDDPMAACSSGGKCARRDDHNYCFRSATECTDEKYPYLCEYDGKCKAQESDCAAPRVCPPGYTQCADRSCVPGLNNYVDCRDQSSSITLNTCREVIEGDSVYYLRCPDGITCTTTLQNCPTETTCPNYGDVVCPDGSCQSSSMSCPQPPLCEDDERPYRCPGNIQGLCVAEKHECPAVSNAPVCPPDMLRCENGQCAASCADQPAIPDCLAEDKILCPSTMTCADSNAECVDQTYCPLVESYTYSPNSVLCGDGAQVCVDNVSQCVNSQCQSSMFYGSFPEKMYPFPEFSVDSLQTCPDGRCMQGGCMTPFSCTPGYIKIGGFGEFCLRAEEDAGIEYMKLAVQLQANKCGQSEVMCLTGECRSNYDDCPQQTTCPTSKPVKCRDGRCTDTKENCEDSDALIQEQIASCAANNLLLCPSDFKSCVDSLQKCPTKSTCPWGLKKCDEATCVSPLEECPATTVPTTCTFWCENTGACVTHPDLCKDVTTCPRETPVLCATDNLCYQSASECENLLNEHAILMILDDPELFAPQLLQVVEEGDTTCSTGSYLCEDGCSSDPCPEWTTCANDGVQCWNGNCASSADYCPEQSNGCPFHIPLRCPYLPTCVVDLSECAKTEEEAQESLNRQCAASLPSTPVGCIWGPSCVASEADCPAEFPATCADDQYPNNVKTTDSDLSVSTCYIPQCPQDLPFKCPSGLCVEKSQYCPTTGDLPIEWYQECHKVSEETGADLRVPCGDRTCVSHPGQCPPLYSCAQNPTDVYRCSDGTCRASQDECRTSPSSYYKCYGSDYPKMCPNGMCAANTDSCLNEVGCPESRPTRCEYTGECIESSATCEGQFDLMVNMDILMSRNFCSELGMVTCFSANSWQSLIYCAESADACFHATNDCSIDEPVYCCGSCHQKIDDCPDQCDDESLQSLLSLRPTNSRLLQQSSQSHPMVGDTYTLNSNLCPESKPFRCADTGSTADCQYLPYTSYPELFYKTCTTGVQMLQDTLLHNRCLNSQLPYGCADGSCAVSGEECPTCNFFCMPMGFCVADEDECDSYQTLSSAAQREYTQLCPQGLPFRCITNGQCAQSAYHCNSLDRLQARRTVIAQNFIGSHIDSTCNYEEPIRCADGTCVDSYDACISEAMKASTAFSEPVLWGGDLNDVENFNACQVVCQDGSCRDRQENCPLILACSSPQKPHRCRSGFCAKDQAECADFFGTVIEDEPVGDDLASESCDDGTTQKYVRCEDGICRPAVLDLSSGLYLTTCLEYLGCPVDSPYSCPTGECVASVEECMTSPYCYEGTHSGLYQCKNMDCKASPEECPEAAGSQAALQMELTVNPFIDNTFEYAYLGQQAVARLVLPANSLKVDLSTEVGETYFDRDIYQKLVLNPVPQSVLDETTNFIQDDSRLYLEQWFWLTGEGDGGYLSSYDTILAPPVFISTFNETEHVHESDLNSNADARIEFYLNEASLPELLSTDSDFCLGRLVSTTNEPITNTTATGWTCLERAFTTTSDGWWSFPITTLGGYSLIVNPDPLLIDTSDLCDNVWCEYKLFIIIGGLGFMALVGLVFFLLMCCKRRKNNTYASSFVAPVQPEEPPQEPEYHNIKQTSLKKKSQPAHNAAQNDDSDDTDGGQEGRQHTFGTREPERKAKVEPLLKYHQAKDKDYDEDNVVNDYQQYAAPINSSFQDDQQQFFDQNNNRAAKIDSENKGKKSKKKKKKSRKAKEEIQELPSDDASPQFNQQEDPYDVQFENTARRRNQYDNYGGEYDQQNLQYQQQRMLEEYGLEDLQSESSHNTQASRSMNESIIGMQPVSRKKGRGMNTSQMNSSADGGDLRFANNFIEKEQALYQDVNAQRAQIPKRGKKRRKQKSKSPLRQSQEAQAAQRPRRIKNTQQQQYQDNAYRNQNYQRYGYGSENSDENQYGGEDQY